MTVCGTKSAYLPLLKKKKCLLYVNRKAVGAPSSMAEEINGVAGNAKEESIWSNDYGDCV